jgi:DNA adenine methylase
MENKTVAPILKWAGSKLKLASNIVNKFPVSIKGNYLEPFLGGCSILLEFLNRLEANTINLNGKIYVNDSNVILIKFYQLIQETPDIFFEKIDCYIKMYNDAKNIKYNKKVIDIKTITENEAQFHGKETLYYFYRKKYNKLDIINVDKLILFFFLNRTCFRGLHRTGVNGFNVPFGNYTIDNMKFYDKENVLKFHVLLNKYDVIFEHKDFTEFLKDTNSNDFIYLDPPYYGTFSNYNVDDFTHNFHLNLNSLITKTIKCKFIMSNSNCEFNCEKYSNYKIEIINVKYKINSKNPQKKETELVIINV